MWHMDDSMGWWMALGSLWFVFFWAVVVWAIVRVTERSGRDGEPGESAIEILRRRYALHSHSFTETPRLFYMHFFAEADAMDLAKGLRAALDKVSVAR